MPQKHEEETH